jgi:hypothetical protein
MKETYRVNDGEVVQEVLQRVSRNCLLEVKQKAVEILSSTMKRSVRWSCQFLLPRQHVQVAEV